MPESKELEQRIFSITDSRSFNELTIDIFYFQYSNNQIYRSFVDLLHVDPTTIGHYTNIPFLPIEFFKDHKITSTDFKASTIYMSSGTTGQVQSKHYVKSLELYEQSFINNFEQQFGSPEEYIILALLPSYLEREGSSLVYMAEKLINTTKDEFSGFYLNELKKLASVLEELKNSTKKVLLLGVTYALLDLAEAFPLHFPELLNSLKYV